MRDLFKIPFTKFCSRNLASPPHSSPLPLPLVRTLYYWPDCWKEIKQGSFCRGGEERVSVVILPRNIPIGHFTVMDGSEGEGDLVLIQTFFALLWKLFLKNTSKHKNKLIYMIKQEGLYQSKVTLSLASIHNCKMAYSANAVH